jgi:flagellar basal body-associated protein FliL
MSFKEIVIIVVLIVVMLLLGIFIGYILTGSKAVTTIFTYTQSVTTTSTAVETVTMKAVATETKIYTTTEYITPKPVSKTETFEKERLVIIPANNMISFSYNLQHYGYLKISFNSSEPIYIQFSGNATLIDYYPISSKTCALSCKLGGICVAYGCSYNVERTTNGLVYVPVFPGFIKISFVNPSSSGATAIITIEYTYQSFEYTK